MKVIERPESTTIVKEIMFHLIKNKSEMNNILKNTDMSNILYFDKYVDLNTYQPMVSFIIKRDKFIGNNMKYIVPLEYIGDIINKEV